MWIVTFFFSISTMFSRFIHIVDFPSGSDDNESACNTGDLGLIPGLGRSPGGGHGNPLQYSCLENPHGQRSLVGYSPWGRRESDMTERPSTHTSMLQRASVFHSCIWPNNMPSYEFTTYYLSILISRTCGLLPAFGYCE